MARIITEKLSHMKTKLINVEEDSDEIFRTMPKRCIIPTCKKAKIAVDKRGFHVCTKCGASYGKKK